MAMNYSLNDKQINLGKKTISNIIGSQAHPKTISSPAPFNLQAKLPVGI